jgi:ATP-dependent DNA helicase RecQ
VDFLGDQRIAAVPYHAKMSGEERQRNQERWMSDGVRVLVGTIAFGLGINKPGVRAVIHLSLPKSIEQFYQEAGRAGRDGNPADCVLLWKKRDAGLLGHFANQIQDPAERERAWQRYHKIRDFAESGKCRHRQICVHFGEIPKWSSCGACDVCSALPDWLMLDATQGTTRESLPPSLSGSRKRPPSAMPVSLPQEDEDQLREYLREWRRVTAKEQSVPAFVVLHDTTLDEICRARPSSLAQLGTITGIGERKSKLYGNEILRALQRFRTGARAAEFQAETAPMQETLQLLKAGKSLEEIAAIRGRQVSTVMNAVAVLVEAGEVEFSSQWINAEKLAVIEAACSRYKSDGYRLKPLKQMLPPEVTYDEIRLVAAKARAQNGSKRSASEA